MHRWAVPSPFFSFKNACFELGVGTYAFRRYRRKRCVFLSQTVLQTWPESVAVDGVALDSQTGANKFHEELPFLVILLGLPRHIFRFRTSVQPCSLAGLIDASSFCY